MDPVLDPVSEDPMARCESQRACQNADAPGQPGQLLALPRSAGRRRQDAGVPWDVSAASARLPLAEVHAVSVGTRLAGLAGYGQRPWPAACRKVPCQVWRLEYRFGNCFSQWPLYAFFRVANRLIDDMAVQAGSHAERDV